MINFLKKYLVLILCGAVVIAALGAGVWFLVNPADENQDDQSQQTGESTGDLDDNLDVDMGFGIPDGQGGTGQLPDENTTIITPDNQGGIVNIPDDGTPDSDVTPVNPDKDTTGDENGGDENTENNGQPIDVVGSVVPNPFN